MVALAKQPNMWHEPVQVQRGDIFQLGKHRLMCGDVTRADEVTRLLDGNACDLIFADPPYGIGIDAWDIAIEDIIGFIGLITSHLKPGGFFAFTHQMPYMVDWLYALKHSRLRYKDHIDWVKRSYSAITSELIRCHENLFIYSYGNAKYFATKGSYSDVKLPRLALNLMDIETIGRHIRDLQAKIKGTPWQSSSENTSGHEAFRYIRGIQNKASISPEFVNFTNVWCFLSENRRNHKGDTTKHPAAKPVLFMNRLLELCTPENALVYDAFLGSGTTLISAENTGRRCVGMELSPEYCASIIERWQEATGQHAQRVEVA